MIEWQRCLLSIYLARITNLLAESCCRAQTTWRNQSKADVRQPDNVLKAELARCHIRLSLFHHTLLSQRHLTPRYLVLLLQQILWVQCLFSQYCACSEQAVHDALRHKLEQKRAKRVCLHRIGWFACTGCIGCIARAAHEYTDRDCCRLRN